MTFRIESSRFETRFPRLYSVECSRNTAVSRCESLAAGDIRVALDHDRFAERESTYKTERVTT